MVEGRKSLTESRHPRTSSRDSLTKVVGGYRLVHPHRLRLDTAALKAARAHDLAIVSRRLAAT